MAQTRSSYQSPFGPNKEMGYTRQEFMRLLPRCLSDYEYSISDEVVTIALTSGRIEIHIGDEGERVYTPLVKFPTLPVELKFIDASDIERNRFMQTFDFCYMKGLA